MQPPRPATEEEREGKGGFGDGEGSDGRQKRRINGSQNEK